MEKEDMVYQRLFNIKYNDKNFTIFIDRYGRRTFLELSDRGNYEYPLLDDFMKLHRVYNERDLFISHNNLSTYSVGASLPIHSEKNRIIVFKEAVRVFTGAIAIEMALLIGAISIAGMPMSRNFKLVKENDHYKVIFGYVNGTVINNTNELDEILGYDSVSKEEIIEAINTNNKISTYYKTYAINLINYVTNKYPKTDSRIFYENVKDGLVRVVSKSAMSEYVAGTYNAYDNVISLREDYAESEQVITHEMVHSYHHWKEDKVIYPKIRFEEVGYSLDEAMTNEITNGIFPVTTYVREGKVLRYFLSCVNFNYYDYEREGITKLIKLLNEKYPSVDIDYIINAVDAMNDTEIEFGENLRLEENVHILDEFFEICKLNIDMTSDSIYQPLVEFLKLVNCSTYSEVADHYLNEYNSILLDYGYDEEKLLTSVNKFIIMYDYCTGEITHMRNILSTEDENSIVQDDLYSFFRNFVDSEFYFYDFVTLEELENHYCKLLETYNDYLYCHGISKDKTMTVEEMRKIINKYKGIVVTGYGVTDADVLYPIIEVEDYDQNVNTEKKVCVLNENGKVVVMDKSDFRGFNTSKQDYYFQHRFFKSLFTNLNIENALLNEDYWQDVFRLDSVDYKKIIFYMGEEEIGQDYFYEAVVNIGQRADGTNCFQLKSNSQIIYQDNDFVEGLDMKLCDFIGDYKFGVDLFSLDVSMYLNGTYFNKFIAGADYSRIINRYYGNFTYDAEKDVVNIHPVYNLIFEDGVIVPFNEVYLELMSSESHLCIGFLYSSSVEDEIQYDGDEYHEIFLETVLDYYGLLSKDQSEYSITEDEILNLFKNYVSDIYSNTNENTNFIKR